MQESKIHYIDVGDMTPEQAEKFISSVRAKFAKKKISVPTNKLPEDFKNELQFIFESRIAKLEQSLMLMRASVDKSRTMPCEEVHNSLVYAYGELQKVGMLLDTVNQNLRWHNGDHSMYDGVDG